MEASKKDLANRVALLTNTVDPQGTLERQLDAAEAKLREGKIERHEGTVHVPMAGISRFQVNSRYTPNS